MHQENRSQKQCHGRKKKTFLLDVTRNCSTYHRMEPVPVLARCIKLLAPYSKALHACCLQQCPLATHIVQQKKCFARSKNKNFRRRWPYHCNVWNGEFTQRSIRRDNDMRCRQAERCWVACSASSARGVIYILKNKGSCLTVPKKGEQGVADLTSCTGNDNG